MGVVQRLLGFGGRFETRTTVTSSSLSSSSSSSSSSLYKAYMSSVLFFTALQGFWMPWILIHHQPQGTHPSIHPCPNVNKPIDEGNVHCLRSPFLALKNKSEFS